MTNGVRLAPRLRWLHSSFVIRHSLSAPLLALALAVFGCASPKDTPQQRADSARALFDQTTKDFHLPSADADGPERDRLLTRAADGYERLLKQYPEQAHPCAQALHSLGNVRASQSRLDDAVRLYASVARIYPGEDWEILTSWKSAADLLVEAGRAADAKLFYERILARFDKPDASAVVKTIVRGSRARLTGEARRDP
jgi:tetratricopeptide (TPR) repeat protein